MGIAKRTYYYQMAGWNNSAHRNVSRKTWKKTKCTQYLQKHFLFHSESQLKHKSLRYYTFTNDRTDEIIQNNTIIPKFHTAILEDAFWWLLPMDYAKAQNI